MKAINKVFTGMPSCLNRLWICDEKPPWKEKKLVSFQANLVNGESSHKEFWERFTKMLGNIMWINGWFYSIKLICEVGEHRRQPS
jgi:hypothetical protein